MKTKSSEELWRTKSKSKMAADDTRFYLSYWDRLVDNSALTKETELNNWFLSLLLVLE